jgi:hypothetical protein
MNVFQNLKDTKIKVEYILSTYPKTRDSYTLLLSTFYFHECGGKEGLEGKSAYDFLKIFSSGKLTQASSIYRVIYPLQDQIPALRGKDYDSKKKHIEHPRKKDTEKKVKDILLKFPKTRDDYPLLLATFYFYEYGGRDILENKTAIDFLRDLSNGTLTPSSGIYRSNRHIQGIVPELRGNKYGIRKKLEEHTRKNIKNL